MSATRPTPETDAATFWGRDMGGDKGPPHFECVDADVARKLERERDKAQERAESKHGLWMAELSRVTELEKQLETMREAMRQTAAIVAQIPVAYDHRFFRAGQWANAALAQLQPHLCP